MSPRERIKAALTFKPVDILPLQICPAAGGLFEHGRKLVDLIRRCGDDFGDLSSLSLPEPPGAGDFDPDGRYHAFRTDEWGTTWEYRIFGVWGHPVKWPLNDWSRLHGYKAPSAPPLCGPDFASARTAARLHKKEYFLVQDGGSIFEKLHSVRRFEDVLIDILLDTTEINRLADMIAKNIEGQVNRVLALDADGVIFYDDFGTQNTLLLPPEVWRRFFKPRYQVLFEPIRKAGKSIIFHSCGQVSSLFEDFKELGISALWLQLPLYNLPELAIRSRELGIALMLHPDRGELMQHGSCQDVRRYVLDLVETFGTLSGGSWLYIEIDPGFPFANVEVLFGTAMELRNSTR